MSRRKTVILAGCGAATTLGALLFITAGDYISGNDPTALYWTVIILLSPAFFVADFFPNRLGGIIVPVALFVQFFLTYWLVAVIWRRIRGRHPA